MRTKSKCSLGSMNTLFLSEMNADREDTLFHMQCAGSVAAPPKVLTKAQRNRAVLAAYNAGKTAPVKETSSVKDKRTMTMTMRMVNATRKPNHVETSLS